MKSDQRTTLGAAFAIAAVFTLTGCATRKDIVAQAEKSEKDRSGMAEARAIAEEGLIHGLPIVMNQPPGLVKVP